MQPRRKKRLYTLLTLLFGAATIVGLVLYSLSQNVDFFYTPSEIIAGKTTDSGVQKQPPKIGQRLRVGGLVVPGTVQRDPESLKVSFKLADSRGLGTVTVDYEGILPDLFREGQGIIAQGKLAAGQRVSAFEVLAKHDENYMPPEVAEAVKGIKHQPPEYRRQP